MAKKPNRVISEQQKEQDMVTQNLKRKKNNNLKDQKRTRPSKVSTIIRPLSAKQMGKRAEEALQEIGERFRLAFENANIGMCLVDLQGRLIKVNPQMCEIFGYSQEELEGMTVNDIAHPEDLNISTTFIQRATSGEIEYTHFEKRYFHKDGHIVWGAVSSSLVRDPQGVPRYFISHVQDITQRKKAEEALKEGERFLTNIFSSIQDGISILDTELNILRVNPAMEQWYSHAMPLIGKKCYEAYHGRTERCEVCPTYQTINTGKGAYKVVPKTGKGGKIVGWLDLFSFPLVDTSTKKMNGVIEYVRDITKRKNAEEALRESEERYRSILENIADGYYEADIAGNLTFFNGSTCRMLGYSKDVLMGMNNRHYMDQENAKRLYQVSNKVFKTGEPAKGFDWAIIRKDGTKRFIEASISLIKNSSGQPIGYRGIVRDITEHKQAEETLRQSEEKYRTILEEMEEGYFETDLVGNLTFINDAVCRHLGYPRQELIGMNNRVYADEENAKKVFQAFNKAYKTGEPCRIFDYEITRKDGTKAIIELSASLIRDPEGKPIGFRSVSRDVTERKQKEEALRTEKQRFQTLSEQAPFGMVMIDQDGTFKYINPKFRELFGYDLTDVPTGKTWFKKAYPDPTYRHRVISDWVNDLESSKLGEKRSRVFTATCKDGTEKIVNFISVQLERGEQLIVCEDITERKRAEESLRESEERYRTILGNIEDGYYEVDLPGNFTFFNDSLCRMLGYSRDEMVGMGNQQYTDQENRKKLFQAFNEVYRTGEPAKGFDWGVFRKDGTKVFGEISVSLIKDSKGKPIGFRGIARDITERKQAEEALRTEKQRFQALTENSPFGMVMIDQDGTFKYINPKFRELFGYDLTDIPDGKTWFKKAYPNLTYRHDVIEAWINDLKSFKPGEKRSQIFTVTCKDGTEKTINFIPVQLETGENLMACEDITERKRTEEALRNSEERFRIAAKSSSDLIWDWDILDGSLEWFGNIDERLGYNPGEFPRTIDAWEKIIHPDEHDRVMTALDQHLKMHKPYMEEYRVQRKDGTFCYWTDRGTAFWDEKGDPFKMIGACEDITKRKRAEEEMRALEEQFRQSQKMEAIGRLGGGIAHDFNNLLTVIKGYSQLSLLDLKESDPLWGNIQEIQKATQRATDLTRQLLAFSRRQILDLKVLDLNILLRELDKMLRRIIGEDIELVTLLAGDLGRVKIDPGQIEQVILNLAVNSRDAMPSGGKLTIETANVVLDEEYAHAHVTVIPGHYVRLSISDTGVGMPRELKEKVFEPFFTTKERGKGTGLGLSMVYGIVKQIGGNILVYSEPGHGTTFKIYLPRVEEQLDTFHALDETDSFPRGGETVLLVEDDPSVRNLAHRLLRQQGYRVLEAANGVGALHVAQEHGGEKIHLLLTDVVMPQMGGKELADQLKIFRPDVKVLYTSGYTDDAIVHHGVLEPGIHFLQKPFSLKTLSHKVREVLDR
jgi:two-component system cell cycle sensor histidine kinase/response regulator CckA